MQISHCQPKKKLSQRTGLDPASIANTASLSPFTPPCTNNLSNVNKSSA